MAQINVPIPKGRNRGIETSQIKTGPKTVGKTVSI